MPNLSEGQIFDNRYKLVRPIGQGGFAEVWEVEDTVAGGVDAIKIYSPGKGLDEEGVEIFRREFSLTKNLQHSNLLPVRHYAICDGSPYLVMKLCKTGSLRKILIKNGPIPEEELLRLTKEIGGALEYLHNHGVVHKDIKPDNILVDDRNDFMLSDFGISRTRETIQRITGTKMDGLTISYAPPEMFGTNQKISEKGDIFSLGVMLYELATGEIPWGGIGGMVLGKGAEIPELPATFSRFFQNIVTKCLQEKPEDRPAAGDLVKFIEHPESIDLDKSQKTPNEKNKAAQQSPAVQKDNQKFNYKLISIIGICVIVIIAIAWFILQPGKSNDAPMNQGAIESQNPPQKENVPHEPPKLNVSKIDVQKEMIFAPFIYNDVAYFCGKDSLYAFDINAQKNLWIFPSKEKISTPPYITGKVVYFGTEEGVVHGVDISTQKEQLTFKTGGAITSSPVIWPGKIYFGNNEGYFYAVNEDYMVSKTFWKIKTNGPIVSTPLFFDNYVFFGSGDSIFYKVYVNQLINKIRFTKQSTEGELPKREIPVFSSDDFDYHYKFESNEYIVKYKKFKAGGSIQSSFVKSKNNDIIYSLCSDGQIYAIDVQTFSLKWKKEGFSSNSPICIKNDIIYSVTSNHEFCAIDAGSGEAIKTYPMKLSLSSNINSLLHFIYFADQAGHLYTIDATCTRDTKDTEIYHIDNIEPNLKIKILDNYNDIKLYFGSGNLLYFLK